MAGTELDTEERAKSIRKLEQSVGKGVRRVGEAWVRDYFLGMID